MIHSVRVLLIDESSSDTGELRQKLASFRNLSLAIQSFPTIAEGISRLRQARFDIVLVDLGAPESKAIAALQELQKCSAELPIVALSHGYQESEALEIVRAGAQDCVAKNLVNANALERIISHCIERQAGKSRGRIEYLVSRILSEAESQAEANKEILRTLCEFMEYDFGQVWTVDSKSRKLIAADALQAQPPQHDAFERLNRGIRFEIGRGLPGRVWAMARPLWVADMGKDSDFRRGKVALKGGLRCVLAFPILLGTEVVSVMELFGRKEDEPNEELLKLVANIGNHIGQFSGRKIAEKEKARLTEERLLILDCASEGIYGIDLEGRVTFINRSASRILQCDIASAVGQASHALFHHTRPDGSAYAAQACPIMGVLNTAEGFRTDEEYFWKSDGTPLKVDYSVFPVMEAGRIKGAVVCFSDISQRKKMEVELRHAQKLEAVGRLAAGIAHEINTPIQFVGDNMRFLQNAFREGMEMLEKYEALQAQATAGAVTNAVLDGVAEKREQINWNYLSVEIPKALDQMLEGIQRVAGIVRAMKEFSHVDRSSQKAPADLNKALESTLVVTRSELRYVADVKTEYGNISPVLCHLGDLNQVFLNILINAAHAIGDAVEEKGGRGIIIVRTEQMNDWVEVSISDTGGGIPKAIQPNIFDPFFTTKEVGKGTGQGLTLARAVVVEKHGGTVTFETEVGKGTTFYIRLPVHGTREPQEAAAK